MVRLLGLSRFQSDAPPREITRSIPGGGENGWLMRFFDSTFFCEWIAVSYLYKHDHPGVRDYLCNRMYALPLHGVENYLFQICYMLVHKPSPSLDKFLIDTCAKSLQIALKVHWFLMAELDDSEDSEGISRIQEKCQIAATLMGEWPLLVRPSGNKATPPVTGKSNPVINRLFSSKQLLLSLTSSPPSGSKEDASSGGKSTSTSNAGSCSNSTISNSDGSSSNSSNRTSNNYGSTSGRDAHGSSSPQHEEKTLLKKLMPGAKMREALSFWRSLNKEADESGKDVIFGLFHRDSKDKEDEDADKTVFFGKFLRDSKDKEEEDADKTGFFGKFLRDSKDKDKEERGSDKDGFFRKLLRDGRDKGEDEAGKNGIIKRLLRDSKENEEDESSKDGLSKKHSIPNKDDDQEPTSSSDGIFRRLFSDKDQKIGEEDEKGGFFKRLLFKDKPEEKKEAGHCKEEKENGSYEEEESSDILSFKRLFRIHPEETKVAHTVENGGSGSPIESSPGTESFFKRLFHDRDRSVEDSELFSSKKQKEKVPGSPRQQNDKSAKPPLPSSTTSQFRKGTYNVSLEFVQALCDTSYGLVDIFPIEDRKSALCESLEEINSHIADAQNSGGVCFPMGKGMYRVVHIPVDEAILLNSREKAPYLICVEVLKGDTPSQTKETSDAQKLSRGGIPLANGDAQLPKPPPWAYSLRNQRDTHHYDTDRMLKSTSEAIDQAMAHLWEAKVKFVNVNLSAAKEVGHHGDIPECDLEHSSLTSGMHSSNSREATISNDVAGRRLASMSSNNFDDHLEYVSVRLLAVPGVNMEDVDEQETPRKKEHRRVPSTIAIEEVKAAAAKGHTPPGLPLKGAGQDSSDAHPKMSIGGIPKATDALSGELWEAKKERIRISSRFGKSAGWDLRSVIVKSGDDCRQEHLAVQLVSHFYDIFQEAGLPLWLRPYEVLVTSSYTALIETIPDTASLHSIKSRFPNITSLRDFFTEKYQKDSPNFKLAQRNFVESMAGYSILCYLLQVKDRHNGNLLLDEERHIIHIDFGFMLSNSPGGVNFESAPFKLTRELLEVMDSDAEGTPSDFFDYFKWLCIQGFLTCRKHAERIILLVEMLQDSGFPCFKGGPRAIENLRKRFHLSLTEEQCMSLVLSLISSSLDAWRTRQYDYYQRVLNGIL